MKQLNKDTVKIVTLWIGIAIALLLVFGTFFQSSDLFNQQNMTGFTFSDFPLEQIHQYSSALIETLQSLSF